jgi:hypothetical protein
MKLPSYKRVIIVIYILLTLVALGACNGSKRATRKFEKAVNKFGQKEAANYVISNYPEYFKTITKADTVFSVDTIYIAEKDGVITDPIIMHDTIYIKTKDFSANINKTTGKGTYKIPADTIIKHDTIPFIVKVPCPDADVLALKSSKEAELEVSKAKQTTNFYKLLSFILGLVIGFIGYIHYKKDK